MSTQPDSNPAPDRNQAVGAIAARLSNVDAFGTGPMAELRRLDPAGPLSEPTLQRLLARLPEQWLAGDGVRRWALLIHAMALAAPDNLRPDRRLGAALFEAGLKETRFVNLLDATGAELLDVAPRAVRFLVSKGGGLNAYGLADLIFSGASRRESWADAVRQRIASDYFRAEARADAPASKETRP